MRIIILQGSPNKNGSTNILVEEFSRGAKESGHSQYPKLAYGLGKKV